MWSSDHLPKVHRRGGVVYVVVCRSGRRPDGWVPARRGRGGDAPRLGRRTTFAAEGRGERRADGAVAAADGTATALEERDRSTLSNRWRTDGEPMANRWRTDGEPSYLSHRRGIASSCPPVQAAAVTTPCAVAPFDAVLTTFERRFSDVCSSFAAPVRGGSCSSPGATEPARAALATGATITTAGPLPSRGDGLTSDGPLRIASGVTTVTHFRHAECDLSGRRAAR